MDKSIVEDFNKDFLERANPVHTSEIKKVIIKEVKGRNWHRPVWFTNSNGFKVRVLKKKGKK